jgi:hypothetical protein
MVAERGFALTDRRQVLRSTAAGIFLFQLGGCDDWLTAREAREKGADFRHLETGEIATLEAFGEALVPGAREAGIAHFVDANLLCPHADSLLTIRYLDVLPPYGPFYATGLAALNAYSRQAENAPFAELDDEAAARVVRPMLAGAMTGWEGPPPPLLYLAVRSDAADLVYGTRDAFDRMNVPYLAHIDPPSQW